MGERSTKRQKELLDYVDGFIKEHGYGPSYREIMNAIGYKSVSTVAIHIDGLIAKGFLRKRDNSARSLEVVGLAGAGSLAVSAKKSSGTTAANERWLVEAVNERFASYEDNKKAEVLDELYVLIGSLKVLAMDDAYLAARSRLMSLSR